MKKTIYDMLSEVYEDVGALYLPSGYQNEVSLLQNINDIDSIANNQNSPLWWFIAPVAYNLFGKSALLRQSANYNHTVAVIPPIFKHDEALIVKELEKLGCKTSSRSIVYSRLFVGLLYGGYPWYTSFCRACDELSVFDQSAIIIDIDLPTGNKAISVEEINVQKEHIRDLLSAPKIVEFKNEEYPGLIRPFHMPEPIEVIRHVKATKQS